MVAPPTNAGPRARLDEERTRGTRFAEEFLVRWINDGAVFRDALSRGASEVYEGRGVAWSTVKYSHEHFHINWASALVVATASHMAKTCPGASFSRDPRVGASRIPLAACQASLPLGFVMTTDYIASTWADRYRAMRPAADGSWLEHSGYLGTVINICTVLRASVPLHALASTATQVLRAASAIGPPRSFRDSERLWREKQAKSALESFDSSLDYCGPAAIAALSAGASENVLEI